MGYYRPRRHPHRPDGDIGIRRIHGLDTRLAGKGQVLIRGRLHPVHSVGGEYTLVELATRTTVRTGEGRPDRLASEAIDHNRPMGRVARIRPYYAMMLSNACATRLTRPATDPCAAARAP